MCQMITGAFATSPWETLPRGKSFYPEILIPKVSEHFTNLRSFKFNGRSLAADIHYAEMIVVLQYQRCKLLLSFLKSYN